MSHNIIFKTGKCALSHLVECRLYFVKMSWIRQYMKNHKCSIFGEIQNAVINEIEKHFTSEELEDLLFITNKEGRTAEEADREHEYIIRVDEIYKSVLNG